MDLLRLEQLESFGTNKDYVDVFSFYEANGHPMAIDAPSGRIIVESTSSSDGVFWITR